MEIKDLCEQAYNNSKDHGFHDYTVEAPFNVSEKLMLIVSELSEAQEADRNNHFAHRNEFEESEKRIVSPIINADLHQKIWNEHFENKIKNSFEDEIADTFIRLGDLCGKMNIDIEYFIKLKMDYNKNRPYKHGKGY